MGNNETTKNKSGLSNLVSERKFFIFHGKKLPFSTILSCFKVAEHGLVGCELLLVVGVI